MGVPKPTEDSDMTFDTINSSSFTTGNTQVEPLIPVTARGQATRRKLLNAAEVEFGSKGFHAASVSSITGRAGVGQGTFYLYFHSKEEVFVTLVREIGRTLRTKMSEALKGDGHRLERERAAIEVFYALSIRNRAHFRIVQEAQFVDEGAFREYYERLAADYAASLEVAADRGEIAPGDAQVRAWGLLGMSHFVGMRNCIWPDEAPAKGDIDALLGLVSHGLSISD